ncbi:MAG: hypothetical protein IKZ37_04155 [Bacteroidaceae bacterium]|nr:hypothetical protein [Bacteroidaceae bacterium]
MREQRGEKRLQRWVNGLCACVFALFCFTFVAVYQAPLLEALYDKVATGKLQFNGYVVAAIVTTLLVLLTWWLNRLARFQREWSAFAYLPACILLAYITDIDRSIYSGGSSPMPWLWIFIATFALYALIAFLLQRVLFAKIKNLQMEGSRIVWRNLLLFVIFFCLTGWLTNSEEGFKHEAAAYSRYKHGNAGAALNVARRSLDATHELTAARAFYLAECGQMGDRLFAFPQYYGAEGLLPAMRQTSPLSSDTVYARFGLLRNEKEPAVDYLRRAVENDSVPSQAAVDYYLCALLLDKRLTDFVEELPRYYDVRSGEELPLHYKEALIYYVTTIDDCEIDFRADSLRSELILMGLLNWNYGQDVPQHYKDAFKDYALSSADFSNMLDVDSLGREFVAMLELEKKYPQLHIRSNFIRKHYGNTYWWYYTYSE